MSDKNICSCGRSASLLACSHVQAGGITNPRTQGGAVTCDECAKLRPDETFSPLCGRCLDLKCGPPNPEANLEETQSKKQLLLDKLKKLQSELDELEEEEAESQRRVVDNLLEEHINDIFEFAALFQDGGFVEQKYAGIQARDGRLNDLVDRWHELLSTERFEHILNRSNPEQANVVNYLREGVFSRAMPLATSMQKLFKTKQSDSPFWATAK